MYERGAGLVAGRECPGTKTGTRTVTSNQPPPWVADIAARALAAQPGKELAEVLDDLRLLALPYGYRNRAARVSLRAVPGALAAGSADYLARVIWAAHTRPDPVQVGRIFEPVGPAIEAASPGWWWLDSEYEPFLVAIGGTENVIAVAPATTFDPADVVLRPKLSEQLPRCGARLDPIGGLVTAIWRARPARNLPNW